MFARERAPGIDDGEDAARSIWVPIKIKTRKELLATIRPNQRRFLRADTGDLPETERELQTV
jgi:hypothetical protein